MRKRLPKNRFVWSKDDITIEEPDDHNAELTAMRRILLVGLEESLKEKSLS